MTDVFVPGPARNPWDLDSITSQAMEVLRLEPADPDAERIRTHAFAATDIVDTDLDLLEPWGTGEGSTIPPAVIAVAVSVTVELYRRKDAPFGIVESWSADGVVARIPSDPLRNHRAVMSRYKRRQGVA